MRNRESRGRGKMWNEEPDKNSRQAGQGEQIWKPEEMDRGVGNHRKRKEECMEQDWKLQGRRLGQETTGGEELGEGRRGCRAGTVPVGEAHGYWGGKRHR